MPWYTPTLRETRELVRDNVTSALSGATVIGNNVLRVMSDAMAGLAHLTLRYIDWLARMLMPDTAEVEWLDRHGDIWLTNADGSTGRKMATLAQGTALFTGVGGTGVPAGTILAGPDLNQFEVLENFSILLDGAAPGKIRALDPGSAGNLDAGTGLNVVTPALDNIETITVELLQGGTDDETDDDLRIRVLERIRQPPMGGAAHDYVRWAKNVPGVTRAWVYPNEMGIGTVTVRIMCDELRKDNDGFPFESDCETVKDYIDTVRPVTVKDFWVVGPIPQPIDVHIANLVPDNDAVRASIEDTLNQMLMRYAAPGQTIYAAWKSYAVMSASDVQSFELLNQDDDVMPSPGHMAVLGDIIYD